MTAPYFSVVVPAFNEEKQIGECLRRIKTYLSLKNFEWEIIVCSDGSKDRTDQIVSDWIRSEDEQARVRLLRSDRNLGKGATVRHAVLDARGKFILVTDVDLSSPMKESEKLLSHLEKGFDVAIGSRAIRAENTDVQQNFKRWLSGRIFNVCVKLFVVRDFQDTQCGFKCFKSQVARDLFSSQILDGFCFDVEILYLALKRQYKVAEVPVMWREGKSSKVNLMRDSVRMLKDLFRLKNYYRIR